MDGDSIRVLWIGQSQDAESIRQPLAAAAPGLELHVVEGWPSALSQLTAIGPHVALLDLSWLGASGPTAPLTEILTQLQAVAPRVAVVVLYGPEQEPLLRQGLQLSVSRLQKNVLSPQLLAHSVREALQRNRLSGLLEQAEAYTDSIIQSTPDAVIVMDAHGNIVEFNPAAERIFGYSRRSVLGREMADLIIPLAFREHHRQGLLRYRTTGETAILDRNMELTAMRSDGSEFPVELKISRALVKGKGMFTGYLRDLTRHKQAEEFLRVRVRQQQAVAELSQQALEGFDLSKLIDAAVNMVIQNLEVEYSQVLEQQPDGGGLLLRAGIGWKPEYVGKHVVPVDPEFEAGYIINHAQPVMVEDFAREARFKRTALLAEHDIASGIGVMIQGPDRPFGVLGAYSARPRKFAREDALFMQAVANVLATAIARKQAEQVIAHQAYHDVLTGLPNRLMFEDRLAMALAQAARNQERLAVLFMDLDRFKIINDSLGHNIGDQLLKGVADRLRRCVREGDTIARMGGDEFTLLLPRIEMLEVATQIPRRILEALKTPFFIEGHELHVSASIGIAMYPHAGKDASTLLKHADAALYRAKTQGKDDYQHYSPAMDAEVSQRLRLETDLRNALGREELLLHYQPQVNIATGEVEAVEALVRWRRSPQQVLLPDQFIKIAEETGMIVAIGEWVLRTACQQAKAWQAQGRRVRVAVNLSGRQFQQRDLLGIVGDILKETGLEPDLLELELTETAVMQNPTHAIEILEELKRMGVRLVIDDFGTGYSSLNHLKRFPLEALKIDQSFVRDIAVDESDAAIVTAIILMAHSLGMRVVAEGVETQTQLEFLKEKDCDLAQGFFFCAAVPPEQVFDVEGTSLTRLSRGKVR